MTSKRGDQPYKVLGARLKKLREKSVQSLDEVSGAVEIETNSLTDIESGKIRPSEDVLLLLIKHFSLSDEEASKLWHLAGFDEADSFDGDFTMQDDAAGAKVVMVMPQDARIAYTDMVHVSVNNFGVIMNFMQGAGFQNQPLAVARIGMSKEHAYSVLEVLKTTLEQAEISNMPKILPADTQKDNITKKPEQK